MQYLPHSLGYPLSVRQSSIQTQGVIVKKCLFCENVLNPGGEEHVFLSALGGRVTTRQATCAKCNNDFATVVAGKIDDDLADAFIAIRNALQIWTGRGKPPPVLKKAGTFPDGSDFDLAPGMALQIRRATIPDLASIPHGSEITIIHPNDDDVHRVVEIAKKRGYELQLAHTEHVYPQPPAVKFSVNFGGASCFRSVAKICVLAACALFGNGKAHAHLDPMLLRAIKIGVPDICNYTGWDHVNEWPHVVSSLPHPKTPDACASGFEHSVLFADVGDQWVGYVELFGAFRFSVHLGEQSGLPSCGMSINPRARVCSRFQVTIQPPAHYIRRTPASLSEECSQMQEAMRVGLTKVGCTWQKEVQQEEVNRLAQELASRIEATDPEEREEVIQKWFEERIAIELGKGWRREISATDLADEDEPA